MILESFAECFVLKAHRERLVHEALKRPDKMMQRICHFPEQVFSADYLYDRAYLGFPLDLKGFYFGLLGDVEELLWSEASEEIEYGGGNLFISTSGKHFFANSEGEPPQYFYSASL